MSRSKKIKEKKLRTGFGSIIYRQILICIVLIVAGTIALCWLLNSTFLGAFYLQNKEKTIRDVYYQLSGAAGDKTLYKKSYRPTFEQLCANENLAILIVSPSGSIELSSAGDNASASMLQVLMYTMLSQSGKEAEVLESTPRYTLERQTDSRMNGDFLILWGSLSDGNTVLIRSAVESLKDSAMVSNEFLLFAGLISVILSAVVASLMTSRITKPLTELTEIAKEMADLNFEARYQPRKHKNEIDVLGGHMNRLSHTLEVTIGELKQANSDLQHDLEIRNQNEHMRKDFLSSVSHELKTPISLIQGYAEGLEDGVSESPEDARYYCDVIIDEAKKMNRLVRQLMALNQLEFGQKNIELARFDLTELVSGLIKNDEILLTQNGIEVEFDPSRPTFVWADEFLIEQAIGNFLTNAIHYAKGEKKIRVYFTKSPSRKGGVRVNVYNTGDPIPEESLPHLWEKFYKVDKARTREYGGSGIGLSIVKAVADALHRSCGVENQEGGVLFWLELDTV